MLCVGTPLLAWAAQVPRPVLIATAFSIPFALIWVLTNGLLVRDGLTVVARLGELPPFGQVDITAEALAQGGVLALRGMATLQIGLLVSACIDPDRLLVGVRRIAPRAGLTGAVALRLAPALADDGRRYADGLRCRADGGDLGGRERLLVMSATVGRAIDRADQVAAILELRGLRDAGRGAAAPRTRWSRHDLALTASAALTFALSVGRRHHGPRALRDLPDLRRCRRAARRRLGRGHPAHRRRPAACAQGHGAATMTAVTELLAPRPRR